MGFGNLYSYLTNWFRWPPSQGGDTSSSLVRSTIWVCGGMVDTPALGAGPFGGVGSNPTRPTNGNIAQSVELHPVKVKVVGSNPTVPANLQQENKQQFTYYLSAKKGVAVFEPRQARRACSLIGKTCKKFSVISVVSLLVEQPHLRNSRLRGTHGEGRKGLAVTILDSHSKYWGFESFTTDNFFLFFENL